jgi:hypothetical protein
MGGECSEPLQDGHESMEGRKAAETRGEDNEMVVRVLAYVYDRYYDEDGPCCKCGGQQGYVSRSIAH